MSISSPSTIWIHVKLHSKPFLHRISVYAYRIILHYTVLYDSPILWVTVPESLGKGVAGYLQLGYLKMGQSNKKGQLRTLIRDKVLAVAG